ncbi:hypothetical protein [Paenibacillus motobuensis]|uniref:General stress protein 17M-like domain-containing protein n=1 Tax=Paenibacillus motobuensis TaxID=295324 RepID=A0ABP3IKW3_9BACL
MGEKNILAYFKSPEEAEGVARKLNAIRALDVSVDRFSRYSEQNSGLFQSLADRTGVPAMMHGSDLANSSGVLYAADPSHSGMSHGGQGGPTGHDILLTAVVDESMHHQALRIVEEAGGLI